MSAILIFGEHLEGKIKKTTGELISKAKQLSAESGGASVVVAFIGQNLDSLAKQAEVYGAQKVALVQGPSFEKYNTIAYSRALTEIAKQVGAQIVLGTASPQGKDIFPRLAVRLEAGMASDATELKIESGKLLARKPIYSGKAFTNVVFNTSVQVATTRPNSFPVQIVEGNQAEVINITPDVGELRAVLKEVTQGVQGKTDLTEAEIIVSGGRAMANADNFKILHALAEVVGATVGASRAAVDSGFASHDMQVGQTGKVVNPKLYIACGISGAIQHLAGMRTSKIIVAINKDAEAPIFSKADYSVVGDLFTIVPLLTEEFKKIVAE